MEKVYQPLKICALLFISFLFPTQLCSQSSAIITIHIRGVYESKISIIPLFGSKQFKTLVELNGIKNNEIADLQVPVDYLPGEFILRFDYKEKRESAPYPAEKRILINNQNVELWVHPMYANNPDSIWFQKSELENSTIADFNKESSYKQEKLALLQQFMMNYDDTGSKFYQQGLKEYEKRRQEYNNWLTDRSQKDKALFASSLYRFNYIPAISWNGSEKDRMLNVINHYFDGVDFNDPIIIRTSGMNDLMNNYVNLHGKLATSVDLRDSLLSSAAKTAIEKAKQGNPLVYGWMVDYFYRGFESNNLPAGMKVLQPYLDDPNCLTTKRMEIERRLKGMTTLVPGVKAPEILLKEMDGKDFKLSSYNPPEKYTLLLFWSADCQHCTETIDAMFPWYQQSGIKSKMSVLAISLDETYTEIKAWGQKITKLSGWKHLRVPEGVNSQVATDYFVLATPVMILLDSKTQEIIALPSGFSELKSIFLKTN